MWWRTCEREREDFRRRPEPREIEMEIGDGKFLFNIEKEGREQDLIHLFFNLNKF